MNQYDQNRLEETPEIKPYFSDIPHSVATRAYNGTSHSPERAASIIKAEYALQLIGDIKKVNKIIERAKRRGAELDDNHETFIESWAKEHREGLKSRYIAYLHSHSSVMSSMITGPARFPVARNQKRMGWADNKYSEIGKFQHTSIKGILRLVMPWGDGTAIASNDPRAIEKIKMKIEALESQRDFMKEFNKIARRYYKKGITEISTEKHNECISELVGFSGCAPEKVEKMLEPDWRGVVPFPSYTLTNTGAEIRRLQQRLKEVSVVQSTAIDDEFECASVSISDKQQIAISFEDKPNAEIREKLGRRGFGYKWSRYQEAWVRKMTPNAIALYERDVKPFLSQLTSID